MTLSDFVTNLTCANCKTTLIRVLQSLYRVTETEPDATILCPNCGAFGGYKEVTEQGAGLIGGWFTRQP